jgi:hypothetical protein
MMDGLQIQWLRNPETTDLVQEWSAAAEALFGPFTEADRSQPGQDRPASQI